MDDLSDPERSFSFVQAATEKGDFHGAIAALERIRLLRPELSNIQLELGVLYMRVGAVDRGRVFVQRSLESPDVPPEVRARAEAILASAESARSPMSASSGLRKDVFFGLVSVGGRYESNANSSPKGGTVLFVDLPRVLDDESTGHSDIVTSVAASASYLRLFEIPWLPRVQLSGQYLSQFYDDMDELDFSGPSVDFGPWLRFGSPTIAIEVRPYVSYAAYRLDNDRFAEMKGVGLSFQSALSERDFVSVTLLAQDQRYIDSPARTVSDRTGDYFTYGGQYTHQLAPNQYVSLQIQGERASAREDYQSYDRYVGGLGYRLLFDGFLGQGRNTLNLAARFRATRYDEADPQISATRKRKEDRTEIGLDWSIPVYRSLAVTLNVQHTINDANIPNVDYDNTSAGMSAEVSF